MHLSTTLKHHRVIPYLLCVPVYNSSIFANYFANCTILKILSRWVDECGVQQSHITNLYAIYFVFTCVYIICAHSWLQYSLWRSHFQVCRWIWLNSPPSGRDCNVFLVAIASWTPQKQRWIPLRFCQRLLRPGCQKTGCTRTLRIKRILEGE